MKKLKVGKVFHRPGNDALWNAFEMSKAHYLIWPRVFMQSMPDDWKLKMARLMKEADEMAHLQGYQWPEEGFTCHAMLKDSRGRYVKDTIPHYRHCNSVFKTPMEEGE